MRKIGRRLRGWLAQNENFNTVSFLLTVGSLVVAIAQLAPGSSPATQPAPSVSTPTQTPATGNINGGGNVTVQHIFQGLAPSDAQRLIESAIQGQQAEVEELRRRLENAEKHGGEAQ